jgi:hypothetical protein
MDILSLNEELSDYNLFVDYYETNKEKPIEEWLVFDGMINKPSKQGVVGLFKTKDGNHQCIFKISQYINYLVYHELVIMQGLQEVSSFCPHFCKGIGMITVKLEANIKKDTKDNPFDISNTKYPINKDVLLSEYIENSTKFYNYIRSPKIDENILFSIIKQVLLGVSFAQKLKKFTHYDLHSFNVMIKKCNKDIVFLYKMDESNQFCVPSLGTYPVIIDFGFSYIENLEDGPMWGSLAHTDVGFTSDRYDWVADPKLFLVTVSEELKYKRNTKKSKKLRRIVRNIFHPLKIDWQSGWDDLNIKGASNYVLKMIEKKNNISKLFYKFDIYCIDIIQTLIILPLQEQSYDDIELTYVTFLNEWVKIENQISNPFYNLYILKGLIDVARTVRPEYINKNTRYNAVSMFQKEIYDLLDSVAKFCRPKDVHFEKLLCSLYLFSKSVEGLLFEIMKKRMSDKQKEYDNLPVTSIDEIYAIINTNIPDEYVYNEKTKVLVMDMDTKDCKLYTLPKEELKNINKITHLARGSYIYDLYKNNF